MQSSIKCASTQMLKISLNDLRLETTLKSGQSFRWVRVPITDAHGDVVSFRCAMNDRVITLVQNEHGVAFTSTFAPGHSGEDDTMDLLRDYLNLDTNLSDLYKQWSSKDAHFRKISKQFLGLRMLRQDPFENLLSFICSSNNNISRITQMVQNLCRRYGQEIATLDNVTYYDFPKLEALMHSSLTDELRSLGFGYRAKFIAKTVSQLSLLPPGYLDRLRDESYMEAHTQLMQFTGVGAKVADCVCLMSLDKMQAVPVDTHVLQIARRDYKFSGSGTTMTKLLYEKIKKHFIDLWGPYAGWAHSVLFVADLKAFQAHTVIVETPVDSKDTTMISEPYIPAEDVKETPQETHGEMKAEYKLPRELPNVTETKAVMKLRRKRQALEKLSERSPNRVKTEDSDI